MASRLYTWGRWAVRRRGRVIGVWLLLLAVVGGLGITLHGKVTTEFSVPATTEGLRQAAGEIAHDVLSQFDMQALRMLP